MAEYLKSGGRRSLHTDLASPLCAASGHWYIGRTNPLQ